MQNKKNYLSLLQLLPHSGVEFDQKASRLKDQKHEIMQVQDISEAD